MSYWFLGAARMNCHGQNRLSYGQNKLFSFSFRGQKISGTMEEIECGLSLDLECPQRPVC